MGSAQVACISRFPGPSKRSIELNPRTTHHDLMRYAAARTAMREATRGHTKGRDNVEQCSAILTLLLNHFLEKSY
jgi:hypothetical protein